MSALNTQDSAIAKRSNGAPGKEFTAKDYEANQRAMGFLARDLAAFNNYAGAQFYPVFHPEDYGIDVPIYASYFSYMAKKDPIAFIELEIKEYRCCPQWDAPGKFPINWKTTNFLGRKSHLAFQSMMTFWVCYNFNGTDCMTLPLEYLLGQIIAKNSSKVGDAGFIIPKEVIAFGRENIIKVIDCSMAAHHGCDSPFEVQMTFEDAYEYANRVYCKIHRFDDSRAILAHKELVFNMQKGILIPGVSEYL